MAVVNPKTVASVVGQGGEWSRYTIAEALGRKKTTHVIACIERAVDMGLIVRAEVEYRGKLAYVYMKGEANG